MCFFRIPSPKTKHSQSDNSTAQSRIPIALMLSLYVHKWNPAYCQKLLKVWPIQFFVPWKINQMNLSLPKKMLTNYKEKFCSFYSTERRREQVLTPNLLPDSQNQAVSISQPGCGWSRDHPESGWQKNLLEGWRILLSSRPNVLEYPPTLQFWMDRWSRDQPQPGSLFQRLREAEKRDPGNEVEYFPLFISSPITLLSTVSFQKSALLKFHCFLTNKKTPKHKIKSINLKHNHLKI